MEFKLRPFDMQDLESLVQYANNANIAKFMMNKFPHPYTKEAGQQFISYAIEGSPLQIFAIEVEGRAAGGIGIHPLADVESKNAEMGYWLAETYWGHGIITNAIKQMIDYGFSNFNINRIFARPFGTNVASQKVLQKAGFKLEATLEKTFFKNGEYLDELVYAVRKQ